MSLGSNLFSIMSANAAVQAFVGVGNNARIYAGSIPQNGAVPAYVFNVIAGTPDNILDGAAPADRELIQLTAWTANGGADVATAMREAARAAFEDQAVLIAHGIGAKCVAFYPDSFEPDTKRFGRSIGISFWTAR